MPLWMGLPWMGLSELFQGASGSRTHQPMLAWSPPRERRGHWGGGVCPCGSIVGGTGPACCHLLGSTPGAWTHRRFEVLYSPTSCGPIDSYTWKWSTVLEPEPCFPVAWRRPLLTQRVRVGMVSFQARAGKEAFLLEACSFLSPSKFLGLLRPEKAWE